jgi:hypothetical protein
MPGFLAGGASADWVEASVEVLMTSSSRTNDRMLEK